MTLGRMVAASADSVQAALRTAKGGRLNSKARASLLSTDMAARRGKGLFGTAAT